MSPRVRRLLLAAIQEAERGEVESASRVLERLHRR